MVPIDDFSSFISDLVFANMSFLGNMTAIDGVYAVNDWKRFLDVSEANSSAAPLGRAIGRREMQKLKIQPWTKKHGGGGRIRTDE